MRTFERSRLVAQLAANDLARRPAGLTVSGLLQGAGVVTADGDAIDEDVVGIWRKAAGRRWIRDERQTERWTDWADVDALNVDADVTVLWCGESVARCHFFDPVITAGDVIGPALEGRLPRSVSVIDLACRNQNLRELSRTIAGGMAHFNPDVVIVFAGNNWEPYLENRGYWDSAREVGLPLASAANWQLFRANLDHQLAGIADAVLDRNVPLVWIVPEYNLRGWQPAYGEMVPWLPGGGLREWFAANAQACAAAADGDVERTSACASAMMALDGGHSRRPAHLAARCARLGGDFERERELLELAKDMPPLLRDPPRCASEAQRAIRQLGERGVHVIDLPHIMNARSSDGAPGWEYFLDYCHLNGAGLQLVFSSVLQVVSGLLGSDDPLQAGAVEPPAPEVEAGATWCAAIHAAHWGQPAESVRRLLRRAIELDPALTALLARYVRAQLRTTPRDLQHDADAERAHENPHVARYFGTELGCLYDEVLIDEIGALCGLDAEIEALRHRRLDPDVAEVDYLDDFFKPHWRYGSGPQWMTVHDAAYRVPIAFPASGSVRVWGAARVPHCRTGRSVTASVRVGHGAPQAVRLGGEWTRFDLVFERGGGARLDHLHFDFEMPPWDADRDPLALDVQPAFAHFASLFASAVLDES